MCHWRVGYMGLIRALRGRRTAVAMIRDDEKTEGKLQSENFMLEWMQS